MKVLGLVAEYNPFHNGHYYHLNKSIEITGATHTVAVMSGNFLQRGEPALLSKWQRAKMAIDNGVDLVIELPTAYACSTAEFFAFASINLLHNLNIVNYIAFASEIGDISVLKSIAKILSESPKTFRDLLKKHLSMGCSFPVARSNALLDYYKSLHKNSNQIKRMDIQSIISNPNNILSIEYLKALNKLNSSIIPHTFPRMGANYHSTEIHMGISSATAIREYLRLDKPLCNLSNVMPLASYKILKESYELNLAPIFKEDFTDGLLTILRRKDIKDFAEYFDLKEGLENRFHKCCHAVNSLDDLYNCIKSKRYPMTRIQRICIHILLNLRERDLVLYNKFGPQYVRVLGFNNKGRQILKLLKSRSILPIITKLNHYTPKNSIAKGMLDLDIRASSIYGLAMKNHDYATKLMDYYESPYYNNK